MNTGEILACVFVAGLWLFGWSLARVASRNERRERVDRMSSRTFCRTLPLETLHALPAKPAPRYVVKDGPVEATTYATPADALAGLGVK